VLGAFDKVKEMTISTAFGAAFVIVSSLLLLFCHLLTIQTAVVVRVISEAIVCVMRSFHALPLISKRANS
jgi:PST family polysaccharide transporter